MFIYNNRLSPDSVIQQEHGVTDSNDFFFYYLIKLVIRFEVIICAILNEVIGFSHK